MKRSTVVHQLVALLAIVLWSVAARADSIQITLLQTVQTGAPGGTVTFSAKVTNLTGSTIFFNGDTSTTTSPLIAVDDNPFLNNAPLSLAGGASIQFPLFAVLITPGTPFGLYGSNTFSIRGGANGNTFDPIGSTHFNVNVSQVPEPGSIVLLTTGLLGLGFRKRLIRR